MFNISWFKFIELIILGLIALCGLPAAIYYLKKMVAQSRHKLKADLEILNMLDEEDPKYDVVRNTVENNIDHIYKTDHEFRIYSYKDLIGGSVLFIFSLLTSYYIYIQEISLIFRLPILVFLGILLLGGIGGISQGFEKIEIENPDPCINCKHNRNCDIQSDYMEFWNKHIDNIERGEFYCRKFSKK